MKKNFKDLDLNSPFEAAIYHLYLESIENEEVIVEIEEPKHSFQLIRNYHIETPELNRQGYYGMSDTGTLTKDNLGNAILIEVPEDQSMANAVKAVYIIDNHYIYYF